MFRIRLIFFSTFYLLGACSQAPQKNETHRKVATIDSASILDNQVTELQPFDGIPQNNQELMNYISKSLDGIVTQSYLSLDIVSKKENLYYYLLDHFHGLRSRKEVSEHTGYSSQDIFIKLRQDIDIQDKGLLVTAYKHLSLRFFSGKLRTPYLMRNEKLKYQKERTSLENLALLDSVWKDDFNTDSKITYTDNSDRSPASLNLEQKKLKEFKVKADIKIKSALSYMHDEISNHQEN